MKKLMVSKREACELLGVSRTQLDRWEFDPKYQHLGFPRRIRAGGKVFWLYDDLERFVHRLFT